MTAREWVHAVANEAKTKIVFSSGADGSVYEMNVDVPWNDDTDEEHAARLKRKLRKLMRAMLLVDAATSKDAKKH